MPVAHKQKDRLAAVCALCFSGKRRSQNFGHLPLKCTVTDASHTITVVSMSSLVA
jgi:hypothetical protein